MKLGVITDGITRDFEHALECYGQNRLGVCRTSVCMG